jgi:transcriptional regulator with XRE-family HTH domain
MNIGGRIKQRLTELGWSQARLIEHAAAIDPEARVTKSALSNIIKRDSVRSELDTVIAKSLGVSLLWLVYGAEENASENGPPKTPCTPAPDVVKEISEALEGLDQLDSKSLSAHLLASLYDWQRNSRTLRKAERPKERSA